MGADALTPRERQVIQAIRHGRARSKKAIARRMGIRTRTIEHYIITIGKKLPADYEPTAPPFLRVVLWAVGMTP